MISQNSETTPSLRETCSYYWELGARATTKVCVPNKQLIGESGDRGEFDINVFPGIVSLASNASGLRKKDQY